MAIQLVALLTGGPLTRIPSAGLDTIAFLNKFAGWPFAGRRYGEYIWSGTIVLALLAASAWS